MLAALVLPILAAGSSASSSALLNPRTVDDIWGGVNVSKAALDVYNSISSPTCNATDYCVEFATKTVPRCTALQGTAGCWCTLHDPLHYCAICMSNPTDNTTTSDQTQLATTGHADYHKGCGAWLAFINSTASGSASLSSASSTSSSTALSSSSSSKSNHTGAIVGGVIGGIGGLIIILAILFLLYRRRQNRTQHYNEPKPELTFSPVTKSSDLHPAHSGTFGGAFSDISRTKSEGTLNHNQTPPPPTPSVPFHPKTNRPGEYDTSILEGYPRKPEVME